MNANESESVEKLLSVLKEMTRRDFFEGERKNEKLINFLRIIEALMIAILSISFLLLIFASWQVFAEAPKDSLFNWSLGLALVFSILLFLCKFIEMRYIYQIDYVDGFFVPNMSNFKALRGLVWVIYGLKTALAFENKWFFLIFMY